MLQNNIDLPLEDNQTRVDLERPRHNLFEKFLNSVIPQDVIKQNNPALDGLRATAALMVLFYHLIKDGSLQSNADPAIKGNFSVFILHASGYWEIGSKGVELFFLLSAFLLFQPYSRLLFKPDKKFPSTRQFLKRRFLRIFPAYLFSLILMVLIFTPQLLNPENLNILLMHFFLVFDYSIKTTASINPAYWSLAVETRFYLLVPLIALVLCWLLKNRNIKYLTGFIGIFLFVPFNTFIVIILFLINPDIEIGTYAYKIVEFLPIFFAGIACSIVYVYLTEDEKGRIKKEKLKPFFNYYGFFGLLGLLVIPNLVAAGFIEGALYRVFEEQFLGICFGGILLATLLGGAGWGRVFAHPLMRFIGIISYSLYLWHENIYNYIIIPFARSFKQEALVLPLSFILTFVITIPFAYFCYMAVERTFYKTRKPRKLTPVIADSCLIPAKQIKEVEN